MNTRLLLSTACLCLAGQFSFAQSNSVTLLNGGGGQIGQYNSITAAYGAIPSSVSQAYTIRVETSYTGANETFPITFVNKTGASSSNTITVIPSASASNISIQSSVSGDPIFYLNNADFVRIDGRAGGTGSIAFTIANTATNSNANTIELVNGASNNIVRNCSVNNGTSGSAGRNIAILAGSSNSDNLVLNNILSAGRYAINLNGSTSSANTGNVIRGNVIINPVFCGIWIQSGNDGVLIDSNEIFSTNTVHDADYGVILFDSQSDTAIVSRNYIHDLNTGTNSSATIGAQVRSVSASGSNYVSFENNFIDLSGTMSSSTSVIGIKLAGSGLLKAGIYFNTIRLAGTLSSGGTSGSVGSACVQNVASNASNALDSKNNIFLNNRSGGTSGLRHVCSDISSTSGTITGDYNIYLSSGGQIATLGTTLFTTLGAFQTAVSPNEINANTQAITFASSTDLHLDGSMAGNTNLSGTTIAGIGTDIDGELRSVPMRGADELPIPCTGTPNAGIISFASDTVCPGDSFNLSLSGQTAALGITYQWQSRPQSGTFSNVSGGNGSSLYTGISAVTEFRCILTCDSSSLSDTTDTATFFVAGTVAAGTISATNTGNSYSFTTSGTQNETGYYWSFGDGNTDSVAAPTHNYALPGTYTVTFVASNICGTDTVTQVVDLGCFGTPDTGAIITSDIAICPGESVDMYVFGLNAAFVPYYDFQWQQSVNSAPFSDITGATNDSLTIAPTQSTAYRCVVTCSSSGIATNTNAVDITVETSLVDSISFTNVVNDYTFTAHGAANITSNLWDFGDGNTSTVLNPTHTYDSIGTYTVIFYGYGPCDTITLPVTVEVECIEEPTAGVISSNQSSLTSTFSVTGGSSNVDYMWTFGDGSSGTGANPTHVYPAAGTYQVKLVISNDCGSDSTFFEVSIVIGVEDISSNTAFSMYPNPTEDATSIIFNRPVQQAQLRVINTQGQLVYTESNISSKNYVLSAQALDLPAGHYFVEITTEAMHQTKAWVVK